MDTYCIGVDFGTQSGRALLVRLRDGREIAVSVLEYGNGIMTRHLPSGKPLPPNFALQDPRDYFTALQHIISDVIKKAGIRSEMVLALGIATTASTILPVKKDGTPLCFLDEHADDPHSWIKLWKHHGAQHEAEELNSFLQKYAPELSIQFGACSPERLLPKAVETKRRAPAVYRETFAFIEVADWLVWQLTGKLLRSAPIAGYKSMWVEQTGYLTPELRGKIDPDYAEIIADKLPGAVIPMGVAGHLLPKRAEYLGLSPATILATGYIDAHAGAIGAGVSQAGRLVMVMGTTSCHILLSERLALVEGMSGTIKDGIAKDFYAYEAGQSSVGDQFKWFVENVVPQECGEVARAKSINIYDYLERLAGEIPLGCSGLLALDWWNGNRSVLNDVTLSGAMVGLTTQTRPEEIYLALLESTAFGARTIMESLQGKGLNVDSICVCGGLPRKNELLMDIYANVTNRTIEVAASKYTSALGMAIWAAVAVGPKRGGYATLHEAVGRMTAPPLKCYEPVPKVVRTYNSLYSEYQALHDYFGRGSRDLMKKLRKLRDERIEHRVVTAL